MKPTRFPRSAARRGYASLVGLLLVLVIISILVMKGYFEKDPKTGKAAASTYIDRSKTAACNMDRLALQTQIAQSGDAGSARMPSINILRARFSNFHCPHEGKYQIDKDGNVYCTEHFPAPESLTASVMDLN